MIDDHWKQLVNIHMTLFPPQKISAVHPIGPRLNESY